MLNVVTVTLPWPDAELSPNGRNRWAKIEAVTNARNDGYLLAIDNSVDLPCGVPLALTLEFWLPDRRHYDLDGLISRCKPYLDGIFIAKHCDDHAVRELTAIRHTADGCGGRVVATIRMAEDAA